MAVVNSFPAERVLTLRERAAGMYTGARAWSVSQ